MDNAEHALFVWAEWGVAREIIGQAVGAKLTPESMVSLMLQSVRIWMLIESYVTPVMKSYWSLHSQSRFSDELGCRVGEWRDVFPLPAGVAGRLSLSGEWPWGRVLTERMTKKPYATISRTSYGAPRNFVEMGSDSEKSSDLTVTLGNTRERSVSCTVKVKGRSSVQWDRIQLCFMMCVLCF